jgi:hypothetical protein
MIHDATGKFSSRWVFPDRSSLALVIKKLATLVQNGGTRRYQAHATDREPHIGEYAAKTNAVWGIKPMPPLPANTPETGLVRRLTGADGGYCPWLVSTWSQDADIFGRFCCRQARMVKSP